MGGAFKANRVVYKAASSIDVARRRLPANSDDDGEEEDQSYLHPDVKAPRMGGVVVKVFAWFLESRILGALLLYLLKRNNLIHKLVTNAELEESPLYVPLHPFQELEEQEVKQIEPSSDPASQVQQAVENCLLPLSSPNCSTTTSPGFHRWTVMDYYNAYTTRQITPTMVAERLIAAIEESSSAPWDMGFFINHCPKDILKQASESTLRYERGEAISVLDGVPIAVKDEIDCAPYPTTGGTKWLHKARASEGDAECVARLRQCGAILVGKTNMHELGAGTSGINPHYGATRNPFDVGKIAGGSSSGSAAVVAAGLCPAALGVDGGGSVRMPAALCGVVGFKPTFGRVPHSGVLPLNWTVGMVGVLAGTVEDSLIVYAAISGDSQKTSDPEMKNNKKPNPTKPKLYLPLLESTSSVTNIKLARYKEVSIRRVRNFVFRDDFVTNNDLCSLMFRWINEYWNSGSMIARRRSGSAVPTRWISCRRNTGGRRWRWSYRR
ncbi:unnamed protein product [Linum tenue]|uniref:Amidase domain-containing protein n=1 Tax=Linum tenue TaxID=586396 RepID=A0AAV0J2E0_9ROSI|nr:unnamed protein product [Linum tenue]